MMWFASAEDAQNTEGQAERHEEVEVVLPMCNSSHARTSSTKDDDNLKCDEHMKLIDVFGVATIDAHLTHV